MLYRNADGSYTASSPSGELAARLTKDEGDTLVAKEARRRIDALLEQIKQELTLLEKALSMVGFVIT